jgi:alpha/beta superfamily hydrolase
MERVSISHKGCLLDGRLVYPELAAPFGRVVLAGPHPELGGHIGNNVVRGLSEGLAARGLIVLAFDYSPNGTGAEHASEFRAAVEEMDEMTGSDQPLAHVGYSYGCSVLQAALTISNIPLVLVAPTIGIHDFTPLHDCKNHLLVVAPERDFALDEIEFSKWFVRLPGAKHLIRGEWDGHFFRGHEDRLADSVFAFLRERWEGATCP